MAEVLKNILRSTSVVLLLACTALAAPFDKIMPFTQPDGTTIEVWGRGDEFHAVFESLDGYTVVFDQTLKAYFYATLSTDNSELLSTGMLVGKGDPATLGVAQHLRIDPQVARQRTRDAYNNWDRDTGLSQRWNRLKQTRKQVEQSMQDGPSLMAPTTFHTLGSHVGLCLLIDFDDQPANIPHAEIVEFMNGENYTGYGNNGSIREYYADVSNQLLDFTHVVTVYIRIPNSLHRRSYYVDTSKDAGLQARELINDAIAVMQSMPNFESEILPTFDALTTDDYGMLTAFSVFYAGNNGNAWQYGLWPHSWVLAAPTELSPGGKKIFTYQITDIGASLELATYAHECGHMLCGFPDLYDYNYDSVGGAGYFCLMNSGTAFPNNPPQFCGYLKYTAGWTTTVEVKSNDVVNAMVAASPGHPDFNKFYRFEKPDTETEYYLFENRQQTGRDANLPASGVAIWHIDELGNRDNQNLEYNDYHANYECTLVQADNRWDFQNNVNNGDIYDLWHAGNPWPNYVNAFTDTTLPSSRWWDGTYSMLEARLFSSNGPEMTFRIAPSPPVMHRTGNLPPGWRGTPYRFAMGASGGVPPYTWQLVNGNLPNGLTLAANGMISGLPVQVETTSFALAVVGENGQAVTNLCSINIQAQPELPIVEGFENGGLIPAAWHQEVVSGSKSWSFRAGSANTQPLYAYEGSYNATLSVNTTNTAVTRLVSPMLDFGDDAKAAQVTFWHYMQRWTQTGQDELRVLYKTSWEAEWEEVAAYTTSVSSWTQRTIMLPQPARTAYLAFEGTAAYGYGVCIDNVVISDPTPAFALTDAPILPPAVIEQPYYHQLAAEGGTPPYTFALLSGSLPAGFDLDANGVITGLSSNVHSETFVVRLTDADSAYVDQEFTLTVALPRADLLVEQFTVNYIPPGWTQLQVAGNKWWEFRTGGWDGSNPRAPVSMNYNAILHSDNMLRKPQKTKLITPIIDLGQAPGAVSLHFWHFMKAWDSDQDELRIFYRTSPTDDWIQLAEFTENTPEWTERSMLLPDPSNTYQIAFEGNALTGYGICLDDIRITDATAAPVIRTSQELPRALLNTSYTQTLVAVGGIQPYTWSVISGTLPSGVVLDTDTGVISGVPSVPGWHYFRVQVSGADGKATASSFDLQVRKPASMPLDEDFEHDGAMPEGWSTQVEGSSEFNTHWTFREGSPEKIDPPQPPASRSGSLNACCFSISDKRVISKLITPMLNLGKNTTDAKLTFWHFMAANEGRQDWLKIYYRTSADAPWVYITEFTENTTEWTERTVDLPNPTPTYYIAFEGWTRHGYGVCIDDISIDGNFSSYDSWLEDYFTPEEIDDGIITDPFADPDGDGIPNGLEYAMGMDPTVPDTEGLPTGGIDEDGYLYLTFRMSEEALDAGVIFVVEACTDLLIQDWTTLDVVEVLPRADSGAGWLQAVFRHNVKAAEYPRRFLRLKVILP